MTRYRVIKDNHGGNFGMFRNYTLDQWRKQALEWCYMDERDGLAKEIYNTKDEELLDTIAEIWDVQFKKVRKDKRYFDKDDLLDFTNETLHDFYAARFIMD